MRSVLDQLVDHERNLSGLGGGWEEGFRRFRETVRLWGAPQEKVPCVHVVGSKGKGSVATLLAGLLEAVAGGDVGLYTSPHLVDVRERIRLSGRMIPPGDLERLARGVLARTSWLSWFECLTLCAFLWFRERKAAFAVYEAGLGGRLDATNVVRPRCVVLTPVEREHEDILGPGLLRIASEKLAVVKPGVPLVAARQRPDVLRLAERICRRQGSRLFVEGRDFVAKVLAWGEGGMKFELDDRLGGGRSVWETRLVAPVQARNLAIALFTLFRLFPEASRRQVARRLAGLVLPARFEVVRRRPLRVFDVCHTPGSFRAFAETWRRLEDPASSTLCCFFLGDKDVRRILRLARGAGFGRILWVEAGDARGAEVRPGWVDGRISAADLRVLWREGDGPVGVVGSFRLAPLLRGVSGR